MATQLELLPESYLQPLKAAWKLDVNDGFVWHYQPPLDREDEVEPKYRDTTAIPTAQLHLPSSNH
jgi:hypothetical protein